MENLISGAMLKDMFLTGAALLERNKKLIDSLNVFPVPDGDTGTNMTMTMQGAVKEIRACKGMSAGDIAQAAALGALKGARGNSGVILSQILRGFSKELAGAEELDAQHFARAMQRGTEAAYKAVMKPKEGTILTVSKMVSEAMERGVAAGDNVYSLVDLMIDEGEAAVRLTPELLPVLKEAGVVDSGGKGLITIFHGFKMALDGEEVDELDALVASMSDGAPAQPAQMDNDAAILEDLEDIQFGYCTEFFITHLSDSFSDAELEKLRDKLVKIGDSVVLANDADFIKVHVHSNYPGKILQFALRLGEIDKVKIENMREQNRELLENLKKNEKEIAMIAVSAGEGLSEVFTQLGVSYVIAGGQTMNPSIDSIVKAIKKVNARNVVILPNNSNIILAAQQAAGLSERNVAVIPTKTMPQGIAAATAFDMEASLDTNARAMEEAAMNIVSGAVTYAVRKTHVDDKEIDEGDILGIMDNKIVETGHSVDGTTVALIDKMIEKRPEDTVVTILYGENVDEENAAALIKTLEEKYPDADFAVQAGKQPLYYYYISVE